MECVRDEIQEIISRSPREGGHMPHLVTPFKKLRLSVVSFYAFSKKSPVGIRTPADWPCHPSEAAVDHRKMVVLCFPSYPCEHAVLGVLGAIAHEAFPSLVKKTLTSFVVVVAAALSL